MMIQGKVLGFLAKFVFFATCLLSTMDTHLFVYPSLSQYLLLEVGIIIFTAFTLYMLMTRSYGIEFTKQELFIFLWIAYIIIHEVFIQPGEHYRMYYLCTTLFLIVILSKALRSKLVNRANIETGLLMIASVHLFYIIGQWLGFVNSGNRFFRITGCNENPTVTALLLVGCVPMLMARLERRKGRSSYCVFLVLVLLGLFLLRCRTAYMGVMIEVAVILSMKFRSKFRSLFARPLRVIAFGTGLLLLAGIGGHALYQMKKDSADGRLLIWKLSATMIAEQPQGYGYGLFERSYNLRQSDYFAHNKSTAVERRNADFVYMPYNDYLEQGVEGGVVGMSFLLIFYAIMIWKALKLHMPEETAVLCAFAVMSLSNFVYTSITPWLLLMCYCAFVTSEEKLPATWKHVPKRYLLVLLIPIAFASCRILEMTVAQMRLKQLVKQSACVDDREYAQIEQHISTSEAFWTNRAINCMRVRHYADATGHIRKARLYSSSPTLFLAEYQCLSHIGDTSAAMSRLDTLSNMIPQKLEKQLFLTRHRRHEP